MTDGNAFLASSRLNRLGVFTSYRVWSTNFCAPVRSITALLLLFALAACGMEAPRYAFSPESVQTLRDEHGGPVGFGDFVGSPDASGMTSVTLRAARMKSPYGSGYADYLKEALRQEFAEAGRLKADAPVDISGTLMRNDVDASGLIRGDAELTARIIVRRDGKVVFDKAHSATTSWDSNFIGSLAIPRAAAAYPVLVQRFVVTLMQDSSFLAAIH